MACKAAETLAKEKADADDSTDAATEENEEEVTEDVETTPEINNVTEAL